MARNIALLFAFVFAFRGTLAYPDQRNAACSYCHKLCSVSCFVGTCEAHNTAHSVRKFGDTDKCFSCDPAVSVGISPSGDFMACDGYESGTAKSPFAAQPGMGPQGAAVPGDAGANALKASQQAKLAVAAATKASEYALKAANGAHGLGGITGTGDAQATAANAQTAALIRAEESLRNSEKKHSAWKDAMAQYNKEVAILRRQQVETKFAENALESAESTSEQARGDYAGYQAEAVAATEQAMMNGGATAAKITAQAAAEELAGAASAAHRRLVVAAMEAKDAAEKISIASVMKPCKGRAFIQVARARGSPQVMGCVEDEQQDEHLAPQLPALAPPAPTQLAAVPTMEEEAEPVVSKEQLDMPRTIEQQMEAQLAERLAANPAAVQDPSLFAPPSVPVLAEQNLVDGIPALEQPASLDSSTFAGLQTNQHGNLRQSKMQP